MKKILFTAALLFSALFLHAGNNMPEDTGVASYYGDEFIGRKTASGELYKAEAFTAAHRSLPLGTRLLVTNLENGKKVVVTVNDRGPFVKGRLIDLSRAAAEKIGLIVNGTAKVSIQALPFDMDVPADAAADTPAAPVSPSPKTDFPPADKPADKPADTPVAPQPKPKNDPIVQPAPSPAAPDPAIQGFVKNALFIQVGAFRSEANSRQMAGVLVKEGYTPRIKEDSGIWRVFLKAANDNEADKLLRSLVRNGHKTFLQLKNEPAGQELKLATN